MDIRFKSDKPPVVRFSDKERSAAKLVVKTLAEYAKRMDSEEAQDLGFGLEVMAQRIGLLDKPQEPPA